MRIKGRISFIALLSFFAYFFWCTKRACAAEDSFFYEDILTSVSNILLLVTVVVFCVGVLIYIFVRNQNRKVEQIMGSELYGKLFRFKKNQAVFEKETAEAGRGTLIVAKINNIDFLKELYGESNVEDYVAKVGEKLGESLQKGYSFGRVSLSDFLIYSNNEKTESDVRREIIEIFNLMKETVELNEISVNSNFNMGVAYMSGGSNPSEELFRRATLAMWYSKRQGPNTFAYYTAEIDEKFIKEDELQKELNRALEENEFRLYYQPIIDIKDGTICGFEALIRWYHPEKGILKPDYFIFEAEKNETIVRIGDWVIEKAFRDYNVILNRFSEKEARGFTLSINISPNQLKDKGFLEKLKNMIVEYNMKPENICLEITEQVYIQETLRVNELLRGIKGTGCKIAFDDFGIEYSTLSKLQDLNFDEVKIDRQFILGVPEDKVSTEIIKMLVSLAKITSKTLIAEGVDSPEQVEAMKAYGCRLFQGFYFSKPVDIEKLLDLIYEMNVLKTKVNTGLESTLDESEIICTNLENNNGSYIFEWFFNNMDIPASINKLNDGGDFNDCEIILTSVNNAFRNIFLLPGENMIGRRRNVVYPDINDIQSKEIIKGIREQKTVRFPNFYHSRTGTTYDLSVFGLENERFAMIFMDITDNSRTLNRLKNALSHLENVKYMLDISLSIGGVDVWEYDIAKRTINILWHNFKSSGRTLMDTIPLEEYMGWIHPDDQREFRTGFTGYLIRASNKKHSSSDIERFKIDYRFKYPDEADYRWVSTTAHVVEHEGSNPEKVAAVNIDITQRKSYEETIRFQVNHDGLTQLLNRDGLKPELKRKLSNFEKAAVAFLDLDNFKNVNSAGGHEEGNRVLKLIASNIEKYLPKEAVCARLSGDEFLICFEYKNIKQLETEASRFLKRITARDCTGRKVTASMGIALYPDHSEDESVLMMIADKAMYSAKEAGKNRFVVNGSLV